MNNNGLPPDPPGREFFSRNRAPHPPEDLLPYANQQVAWSADGTRLLASASTLEELEDKLVALGINPNQVVFEYIPDPDTVCL